MTDAMEAGMFRVTVAAYTRHLQEGLVCFGR